MDADPAQVIRSLRLALDMSQAEFARAAGWSPSTISSWERGRAKPSRLAFKTILAFAEERGVRYRPRSPTTTALVAMMPASSYDDAAHTASATRGPRAALRPLLYPNGDDSPRAAAVPPDPRPTWTHERPAAATAAPTPPRWSAEASFRVTLGNGRSRDRAGLPRGVVEVAIVAAAFAAAFTVHAPLRQLLARSAPAVVTPSVAPAAAPASAPVLAAVGSTTPPRAASVPASAPLPDAAEPAADAQPRTTVARLESVMAIGDAARATFRTANDAVTVVSGEWVGGQRVAAITSDGVTLVDRDGTSHRVRVGQHTAFE